jgi:hypothetical protein
VKTGVQAGNGTSVCTGTSTRPTMLASCMPTRVCTQSV